MNVANTRTTLFNGRYLLYSNHLTVPSFYARAHQACATEFQRESQELDLASRPEEHTLTRQERLFGKAGEESSARLVEFDRQGDLAIICFRHLTEADLLLTRKVMGYLGLGYRKHTLNEEEID